MMFELYNRGANIAARAGRVPAKPMTEMFRGVIFLQLFFRRLIAPAVYMLRAMRERRAARRMAYFDIRERREAAARRERHMTAAAIEAGWKPWR